MFAFGQTVWTIRCVRSPQACVVEAFDGLRYRLGDVRTGEERWAKPKYVFGSHAEAYEGMAERAEEQARLLMRLAVRHRMAARRCRREVCIG